MILVGNKIDLPRSDEVVSNDNNKISAIMDTSKVATVCIAHVVP